MSEAAEMPCEARWIGSRDGRSWLFRREFRLEKEALQAKLKITADASYRLRVNGMWFGDGPEGCVPGRWNFDAYELSSLLRIGGNFIEVQVVPGKNGAVLAASLSVTGPEGEALFSCVTDEAWSAAPLPALTFPDDTENFDAACAPGERQPAQEIAAIGDTPWGALRQRAVAPLTRTERLFSAARGTGTTQNAEMVLFPDDRCATLLSDQDAISCTLGEKVNGCWNVVCRAPKGSILEFFTEESPLPALRYHSRGGWQRYTATRRCCAKEVTLKLCGAGPVEIQSLRLVEAVYPAVRRSNFSYMDAREERLWETETAALARRLGRGVEAEELAELTEAAGLIFGADDWAQELLSQKLFTAEQLPPRDRLFILLAAARYTERRGLPADHESWCHKAQELLHHLTQLPGGTLTLEEEFLFCGVLDHYRLSDEAAARKTALAATWNPLRLAFCRNDREPRETALRANLAALAFDAVPSAHLASLRAEAASLSQKEELLFQPELPASLGNASAVLAALPSGSGRAPLFQTGYLLGIRFSGEGRFCTFSPWIGSETGAEGVVHTRLGAVRAHWVRNDRVFTAELELPHGMTGRFDVNPSLAGLTTRVSVQTEGSTDAEDRRG